MKMNYNNMKRLSKGKCVLIEQMQGEGARVTSASQTRHSECMPEILFMSVFFLQRPPSSFMCVGSMKVVHSAHQRRDTALPDLK
jgi:hypothetical protein